MQVPDCHAKFLTSGSSCDGLVLWIREGEPPDTSAWRSLAQPPGLWELWHDEHGRFAIVGPKSPPPQRCVVVDAGFDHGEVVTECASTTLGEAEYPLLNIDIVLYVNWLASLGDVLLHASGLDLGGAGYCFAGSSGAGKSTLAARLASDPTAVVLGEDSVVLRYIDGRFWIYGTPWHTNPAMCSPGGAPLSKLFFLDRTAVRGAVRCGPAEGVSRILKTAFIPYYRSDAMPAILERLSLLAEQVPFYTLSYRLGEDVEGLILDA